MDCALVSTPPRVSARTARKHTGVRAEAARTTRVSGVSARDRALASPLPFPARDGPCDDLTDRRTRREVYADALRGSVAGDRDHSWCRVPTSAQGESAIRGIVKARADGSALPGPVVEIQGDALSSAMTTTARAEAPLRLSAGRRHFPGRSDGRRSAEDVCDGSLQPRPSSSPPAFAMAARLGVLHFASVRTSLVVLLVIAALAGIVSRSRGRAADLRIGRLWPAAVAIRIALALGVSYLMMAKSEIVESLLVMALALAPWSRRGDRSRSPRPYSSRKNT